MAKYYGLGSDEPTENSEKLMADALRRLPDEWVILHHVSWQSMRGGREGDGEADFVVIAPQKGILVIEVKGGGIDIEAGRWITINRHGTRHQIKNPYEQATASKHALLNWLINNNLGRSIRVGHAVAFPHMTTLPPAGPVANPKISLIKPKLNDIYNSINECFDHWQLNTRLSQEQILQIISLLAPTISVAPSLVSQSLDSESGILNFTAEQIEIYAGIKANRGGLILGKAGTGKTVLAIARAQQLAKDEFKTLLVCYNELLGNDLSLRTHSPPKLIASTFHSLCLREAKKAKLHIPVAKPAAWWESDAPNLLKEASKLNQTHYDAIIVDEGQDFSPAWIEALQALLSDEENSPFFVFADPLQDFWKRDWAKLRNSFTFEWKLSQNLRNTQPIAVRVSSAVNAHCRNSGVSGPNPVWQISSKESAVSDVLTIVEKLLNDGLVPSNIVVLCESVQLVQKLREYTIGSHSFGRWQGHGIAVETVARFKGLESQAVVLVLEHDHESNRPILPYVGISRARSLLMVIGSEIDQKKINWNSDQ